MRLLRCILVMQLAILHEPVAGMEATYQVINSAINLTKSLLAWQLQQPDSDDHPDPTALLTETDYCAEILQLLLAKTLKFSDKFYRLTYQKLPSSVVPGGGGGVGSRWRDVPLTVRCRRDPGQDRYLDCTGRAVDFDGQVHACRIARFFVIRETELSQHQQQHTGAAQVFAELEDTRKHYNMITDKSSQRTDFIRGLFEAAQPALQILSPFHLEASRVKLKVRLPSHPTPVPYVAILVPTIPVPYQYPPTCIDVLRVWVDACPFLFYRILLDPIDPLPNPAQHGMPIINPKPSKTSRRKVSSHFGNVIQAFTEYFSGYYTYADPELIKVQGIWDWKVSAHSNNPFRRDQWEAIHGILQVVKDDPEGVEFLDCSHPIPIMTGSGKCPRTLTAIGNAMLARVIHQDRFWIAIRENYFNSSTGFERSDESKDGFDAFDTKDNPYLAYHKFHITKESTGIFIIFVWELTESEMLAKSSRMMLNRDPVVPSQQLLVSSLQMMPADFQPQIFPRIYPPLDTQDGTREITGMTQATMRAHQMSPHKYNKNLPNPTAPPNSPELYAAGIDGTSTSSTWRQFAQPNRHRIAEKPVEQQQVSGEDDAFEELLLLSPPSHHVQVAPLNGPQKSPRLDETRQAQQLI